MIYRKLPGTDIKVSALGMGAMRLPTLPEENKPIDRPAAIKLIRHAIDSGVNYVDTAYGYHNGDSERLVGEALQDGYREKVILATKLPCWLVEKYEDMERLLDEQLAKLKVDHVDVYLLHAVNGERFKKMNELGFQKFLDDMVAKGKIKYPGFSFHDGKDVFLQVLDSYDWKVCQVQMNVLDEFNQATMDGVREAARRGIGVIVMEPVRGGALTKSVPEEVKKLYATYAGDRTAAEWAFRWVIDKPEFMTVLSGMSSAEQLEENIRTFSSATSNCLSPLEKSVLTKVRQAYEARIKVGCTGCDYCQPCPAEVKISRIFQSYDRANMFDDLEGFFGSYRKNFGELACVGCGACVKACPQHFATPIPDMLRQIDEESKKY